MSIEAGRRAGRRGTDEAGHPTHGPLVVDEKPRCRNCGKVLAYYVARPWQIRCSRCGAKTGVA